MAFHKSTIPHEVHMLSHAHVSVYTYFYLKITTSLYLSQSPVFPLQQGDDNQQSVQKIKRKIITISLRLIAVIDPKWKIIFYNAQEESL